MNVERQDPLMMAVVDHEWAGKTVRELLAEGLLLPEKTVRGLLQQHKVLVRNQPAHGDDALHKGDRVRVEMLDPEPYGVEPEPIEIQVMYEDDHVLVTDKPVGLKVHPTEAGEGQTLANAVAYHLMLQGLETKVRHIHRLDQHTSGLVLYAKHIHSARVLDQQMQNRDITREYLAAVIGKVTPKKGTIDAPIGRDRHHPTRRVVSKTGDQAITHYRVISQTIRHSLLSLHLETGRTHQIRAHLAHQSWPILGDAIYGGPIQLIQRQALHAYRLTFTHPYTRESITVESMVPEDMGMVMKELGLGMESHHST